MSKTVSVRLFGDAAVLAEMGDLTAAHRLAGALRAHFVDEQAVDDVVVGFGTVTVLVDLRFADPDALLQPVLAHAEKAARPGAATSPQRVEAAEPFAVPVCFDGADLFELAGRLHMDPAELRAVLTDAELQVAFVGFSPGFAYLVGLPSALAQVGRRERPRAIVPAGSVAVGGGFAGIYPRPSPGGWFLVGRTDAVLFDARHPPYARLEPGQRVRFVAVEEVGASAAPVRRPLRAPGGRSLVVEEAGTCTLVEDGGRRRVAGVGIPGAGAADVVDLRAANRLVGNAELEAALEITLRGPRLRAAADMHVAVVARAGRGTALSMTVDGREAPVGQPVPVGAGQLLEVGEVGDLVRAVLAVSGGLQVEPLFGSRSSDLLSGLGSGALRRGDELAVGPSGRPKGRLAMPSLSSDPAVVRVLAGPDQPRPSSADRSLKWLTTGRWRTAPDSNRIGTRFVADEDAAHDDSASRDIEDHSGPGRRHAHLAPGELPSRDAPGPSMGMVRGAVQLPPAGELVVLGPDHPTVGGYRVPAVVISADLHHLAHLAPGAVVRFELVDHGEAQRARRRLETALSRAVLGWFPTRAG